MYYDLDTVINQMKKCEQVKFVLPVEINYKSYFKTNNKKIVIFKIPPDKENLNNMFESLFEKKLVFDVGDMSDKVYYSIRYTEDGERYVSAYPSCITYNNITRYNLNTFEQSIVNTIRIFNVI